MIGLELPNSTNLFFAEVACFTAGYSVILCKSNGNLEEEVSCFCLLENEGADCIAFVSIGCDREAVEVLAKQKRPPVLIDRVIPGFNIDSVPVDNRGGVRQAIGMRVHHGHRRMGFTFGSTDLSSSVECQRGCGEVPEKAGPAPEDQPIAVDKFGLSGLNDVSPAACPVPALFTVAQPMYHTGQRTAEILLSRSPGDRVVSDSLLTRLALRESHGDTSRRDKAWKFPAPQCPAVSCHRPDGAYRRTLQRRRRTPRFRSPAAHRSATYRGIAAIPGGLNAVHGELAVEDALPTGKPGEHRPEFHQATIRRIGESSPFTNIVLYSRGLFR